MIRDSLFRVAHEAVLRTAAGVVAGGFRGCVLGLDAQADKQKIEEWKKRADETAKTITESVFVAAGVKAFVHAAEGFGRDGVLNSFMAAELVDPLGKNGDIHILSDVIEGTNATVSNNQGKSRANIGSWESGGTSALVSGSGVISLGNAPDMYADQLFAHVPVGSHAKVQRMIEADLTAEDTPRMGKVLGAIALANGCAIGDLELVIMKRDREAARMQSLQAIRKEFPGLEITQISDGTVAHALVASFGEDNNGRHKILWTVGGSPEGFMNLAVAASVPGAVGALRLCSKNINKTATGEKAMNLARRYAFDANERGDLRDLRSDAPAIISGDRLFTLADVDGFIEGNFSFITDNGVFDQPGVQEIAPGVFRVRTLAVRDGKSSFLTEDVSYTRAN